MSQQVIYGGCLQPEDSPQPQKQPEQKGMFCHCSKTVLSFLAILLAATLGLILGAAFVWLVRFAFAALVVLAVVLAILIIALLIMRRCFCCKHKRCG